MPFFLVSFWHSTRILDNHRMIAAMIVLPRQPKKKIAKQVRTVNREQPEEGRATRFALLFHDLVIFFDLFQ
jgi:hypothetical protein